MTHTKESLEAQNPIYLSDYSHKIRPSDVDFANRFTDFMQKAMPDSTPKIGDMITYTDKYGTHYPRAHIDNIDGYEASICLRPYVPFVSIYQNKPQFDSVSGGPWTHVDIRNLIPDGHAHKPVCFFGSSGACAHGSIQFDIPVHKYRYYEPGALFGNYSTELYQKTVFTRVGAKWHCSYDGDPDDKPNFTNIDDWLRFYHGILFGNFQTDDVVTIFSYKTSHRLIDQNLWANMILPTRPYRMNAHNIAVKYDVNHREKRITIYRYTN